MSLDLIRNYPYFTNDLELHLPQINEQDMLIAKLFHEIPLGEWAIEKKKETKDLKRSYSVVAKGTIRIAEIESCFFRSFWKQLFFSMTRLYTRKKSDQSIPNRSSINN